MESIKETIKKIFENFDNEELIFDEARHKRLDTQTSEDEVEPELSIEDRVSRKISNMQQSLSDIENSISNEEENIKTGRMSPIHGQKRIDMWNNMKSSYGNKINLLQKALDQYLNDKNPDSEANLRRTIHQTR